MFNILKAINPELNEETKQKKPDISDILFTL